MSNKKTSQSMYKSDGFRRYKMLNLNSSTLSNTCSVNTVDTYRCIVNDELWIYAAIAGRYIKVLETNFNKLADAVLASHFKLLKITYPIPKFDIISKIDDKNLLELMELDNPDLVRVTIQGMVFVAHKIAIIKAVDAYLKLDNNKIRNSYQEHDYEESERPDELLTGRVPVHEIQDTQYLNENQSTVFRLEWSGMMNAGVTIIFCVEIIYFFDGDQGVYGPFSSLIDAIEWAGLDILNESIESIESTEMNAVALANMLDTSCHIVSGFKLLLNGEEWKLNKKGVLEKVPLSE